MEPRLPAVDGQKGTALASSLWMGAEKGSGVGLAAPLTAGSVCPPSPCLSTLPVRGPAGFSVPWLCPTAGHSLLQQQRKDGEPGRTYPGPELTAIPESPEAPVGTPHPTRREPAVTPLSPRGALLGGCWWDTRLGLTVKNSCAPPRTLPKGRWQRPREAEGTPSPPCPGPHPSGLPACGVGGSRDPWRFLQFTRVYSTGF